jgi:hypothetical protein
MRPECGCRYWANQYAAGFSMCELHAAELKMVADWKGITVQEAFDEALEAFFTRLREEGVIA